MKMNKREKTISRLCDKLKYKQFVDRHKSLSTAFTRVRKLSFMAVFILILRNSVKSLQLILNEFVLETQKGFSITAGAFTKARKKLKHTAYIELNNDVIEMYYQDKNIERLHGYRILAFDGSRITLPKNDEIKKEFGSRPIGNHTGKELGAYCRATY